MDQTLRALERRLRASRDRQDLLALAAARERIDGAIDRLAADLEALLRCLHAEIGSEDTLRRFLRDWPSNAAHLVRSVMSFEGYHGTDGRYGEDPGITELVWDDGRDATIEMIAVFDDERRMVTIGARATSQQDLYTAWPENREYARRSWGNGFRNPAQWWSDVGTHRREPWREWSRASHELAVVDQRSVRDRIRMTEEVAARWLVLHGQDETPDGVLSGAIERLLTG